MQGIEKSSRSRVRAARLGCSSILLCGSSLFACAAPGTIPKSEVPATQQGGGARLAASVNAEAAQSEPGGTQAEQAAEDWLRPCAPTSPQYAQAEAELDNLAEFISGLENDAPVEPALERLEELLSSECFELGARNRWKDSGSRPDSALSLSHSQFALMHFLRGYLELKREDVQLYAPPLFQKTLARELHSGPEAQLYCPLSNPECEPRSLPWRMRMEDYFHALWDASREFEDEEAPAPASFAAWLSSRSQSGKSIAQLPPGGVVLPSSGNLRVSLFHGPKTSTSFERWEIQLADGAFVSTQNSRQESEPKQSPRRGKVNLALLQEALWAVLTTPFVEDEQIEGWRVPPGLERKLPRTYESLWIGGMRMVTCSHRRTLVWELTLEGQTLAQGEIVERGCASGRAPLIKNDYLWTLFSVALATPSE